MQAESRAAKIFAMIDKDGNGVIEAHELKEVYTCIYMSMSMYVQVYTCIYMYMSMYVYVRIVRM
jgi:hypothetical protein